MNRFETLVQETVELGNQSYLQKAKDTAEQTYTLLYRENGRYTEPVELTYGINNEADADQLLTAAEEQGSITHLLEADKK